MSEKVAIITGASSGMGAATARLLAQNGIKVMMAARREKRLLQLCNEITSEGGDASYKVTDVTSYIYVNMKGVLYGMAAVYKHMEERNEGHIINFGSIASHVIFPSSSVYSATKSAIRVLTEGMRAEITPDQKIRTTLICPGSVATELSNTITDASVYPALEKLGNKEWTPLEANDIANTILFAIKQPANVDINEMIVRPTAQSL